jgi:predicted Zn-dependent protease
MEAMKRLLAAALLGGLAACQSVPYTHRSHLVLIPAGEEQALGLQQYDATLKNAKLSQDPAQVELVRRVGRRIAAAADRPDFKWEFNVIDDPKTVNAWCLPGGKVAVYTGILPITQDENGLAVVLGHEVSHALARHGAERMSQGLLAQFGGAALSVALANKPAQTQQLFGAAYGAGAQYGVLLPFSREQESEADHIGLILMAKAGYDPGGAVDFWQRMMKASGAGGKPPAFLSDHPSDEKRIEQIKGWLPEARKYLKR